jgi:hypothetical protein
MGIHQRPAVVVRHADVQPVSLAQPSQEAMSKRTEWFPSSVHPVRSGFYELDSTRIPVRGACGFPSSLVCAMSLMSDHIFSGAVSLRSHDRSQVRDLPR